MMNAQAIPSSDKYSTAEKLNIGGGAHFKHEGWINLEGAKGPENPLPFVLSESAVFPLDSNSLQLVYSSHCLEHLNDATVDQTLNEARRVLSNEGLLLLKLPDFELTQQSWRTGDHTFFTKWGLEAINHTWKNRGVVDTIAARAAMTYCGFWNAAYGDHFSNQVNNTSDAYHGPPVLPTLNFKKSCS